MTKEKVVVVGAGGIAGAWFPRLIAEKLRVAAVVDLHLKAAEDKIAQYGLDAEASTSLKSVLKRHKPDFVLDLTVPESHCKVTCTALNSGCHVLGEKPMASSISEARRMLKASEETGKLFMVSQSRRWNPRHESIQHTVSSGRIGEVTTLCCDFFLGAHFGGFRDQMSSPLILDMAIHHFDLARYLIDKDPVSVFAMEFNPKGSWYKGDVSASCIFQMTDNVVFTYRGSWCSEGCPTSWNGNWRIIGTRGTLLYERDQAPHGQVLAGNTGFNRPLKDLTVCKERLKYAEMHGALREMLSFLRTGKQPQTECHDNIRSLSMVFGVIQSHSLGRRISLS